jgi:hypothetical protein
MTTILLSGAGGSSNWLPLVLPIAALFLLVLSVDFVIKLVKRPPQAFSRQFP